jgi:hypothetical protein
LRYRVRFQHGLHAGQPRRAGRCLRESADRVDDAIELESPQGTRLH